MKKLFFLMGACLFILGCYYDNEEELYPMVAGCDTTRVAYNPQIKKIINDHCIACHNGSIATDFGTYNQVYNIVLMGEFLKRMKHESGFNPMPPGDKISNCEISKTENWIKNGMPENK